MKRENLIGYMADPALLDGSTLTEVEELVETFPYFQTARMLLARNHHNLDSLKFHDMLRSASAFAGDRTVLYHLIHGTLHRQDLQEVPEEPPEKEAAAAGSLSGKLAEILSREPAEEELDFGPAYSLEETTDDGVLEEYTFTGWFDHVDQASPVTEPDGLTGKDTAAGADTNAGPDTPAAPESGLESASGQNGLIDKFLKDQPVIRPEHAESHGLEDRSEASSVADDSLMNETLARIYVKQGLYRKAIYAYEKLSLKYPEKSTYFATLINRIKSQLENE